MSDGDDLRARLARADPARRLDAAGLLPATTADRIRERAMQTIDDAPTIEVTRARRLRPALVLAAAASVAALAVGVGVATRDDPVRQPVGDSTLVLTAPAATAGGPVMSSCIAFDVAILRDMAVAFAGTVAEVGPGTVTLDVDRWYKGGDADQVTVSTPSGAAIALDGVEFTRGERYLVAATDGTVNGCGFSGPATAELEQAYGEAFPG